MWLGQSNKLNRKELEQTCEKLRDLVEKQQAELISNQKHIQHLTENARKWSKKYLWSDSTAPQKDADKADIDSSQRLEEEIAALKTENQDLCNRLVKSQALIEKVAAKEQHREQHREQQQKTTVSLPVDTQATTEEAGENVEIQFSTETQMALARYVK